MSKRIALINLSLLALALLALIATGAVGDTIVVPVLYLFWLAGVLFDSLPQLVVWGAFVLVAVIAAARSLASPGGWAPAPAAPAAKNPSAVLSWANLLERAAADRYARYLLAQRLGQLATELLARDEHTRGMPAWQYLESEPIGMPAELRAFLRAGRQSYQPLSPLRRLWPRAARTPAEPDPLAIDPELAIRFFERHLYTNGASHDAGGD